jgi:hypothetical protein
MGHCGSIKCADQNFLIFLLTCKAEPTWSEPTWTEPTWKRLYLYVNFEMEGAEIICMRG